MIDQLQFILQSGGTIPNHMSVSSRYYSTGTTTMEDKTNGPIVFLRRRFIPPAHKMGVIKVISVKEDDRVDNIAANQIGDPLQFWQIADANEAMKPEELTDEIGTKLRVSNPVKY